MPKYRRGSGSIYKKRGVYYIAYYDKGKQVCESTHTTDKTEARRKLNGRLGEVAKGEFVGPAADRVTFDELVEGLQTDYKMNGTKSLREIQYRLRLHLVPFFGGRKAQEITSADVKAYIVQRQATGAKNGTINLELAILKRAYTLALQAEKITRKPHIPHLQENNARQGFFERADFDAVLAKLPDYLRPPVSFAYQTGWRLTSEILPLTWQQVDLDAGTVRLEVGTTKNKDGRLIYLPAVLRDVLEGQWREHIEHYPECPFVFHRHGKRIKIMKDAWRRAVKAVHLTGKIPHDFRRTAVRNMVRAGIPERVAMQMSGHKTRSIFDRYHIVSDGDLKEAALRLDTLQALPTTTLSTTLPPQPTLTH